MKVAIRADASARIGTGHVARCLALAEQLRREGDDVRFVCRRLPGARLDAIAARGFQTHALGPEDPASEETDARETADALEGVGCDWLIVDHYRLGADWERILRAVARRIMVVDDLADRDHECDLLLDQNYYRDATTRYLQRVPSGCRTLLGPAYALLRDEFYLAPARAREGPVRQVLISCGGVDAVNLTRTYLEGLAQARELADASLRVLAVLGDSPHAESLRSWSAGRDWVELCARSEGMAAAMAGADLAMGAGGTTTLERLQLGLPALTAAAAENQRQMLEDLSRTGAIWHLGWHAQLQPERVAAQVRRLLEQPALVAEASARALALGGGAGERGTRRVAEVLRRGAGAC